MKIFNLDTGKSNATWEIIKNGVSLKGTLNFAEGKLISELKNQLTGIVKVDLNSIEIYKHQIDDDRRAKVIEDIKSADMLNVETFPTADIQFDSDRTGPKNKTRGVITFKGSAYSFSLPLKITESEQEVRVKSKFSIASVSLPLLQEIQSYTEIPGNIRSIELDLEILATS